MTTNRSYIRQDKVRIVHKENPDEESEDNLVLFAANEAFAQAAKETMQVMGYNVIAENGWVVKIFADGTKEKIKRIGNVQANNL